MTAIASDSHPRIISLMISTKFQAAVVILSFCVATAFNAAFWIFSPYDGMSLVIQNDTILVRQVDPGGPADRAGIRVGDQVLAIDGDSVSSYSNRPAYRAGILPGEVLSYTLLRDGQNLTRRATIGSHLDNVAQLGATLGIHLMSFSFWIIGLLFCFFTPVQEVWARLIGLCWELGAISLAAGPPSTFWISYTALDVTWAWLALTLVAAHLYFPTPSLIRYRSHILYSVGAAALLLSILDVLDNWFLRPRGLVGVHFLGLGISIIIQIFFFLAVMASLLLLIHRYFLLPNSDSKRKIGIVVWAMLIGFAPFFGLTLIPLVLFGTPLVAGTYSTLALVLIPLAYAYVVYQQKLVRLDYVINRAIALFVVAVLLVITFSLALGILTVLLNFPLTSPIAIATLATAFSLVAASLQGTVQKHVTRILYGRYYDFCSVNALFSEQFAQITDRERLVNILTQDLAERMGIHQISLFLSEDQMLRLQLPQDVDCSLPLDDEVCQMVMSSRAPMRAPAWALLPPQAHDRWQAYAWAQLLVPIIFEGHLDGLLILGSRSSANVYNSEDLRIIETVADQAALAYANVRSVEALRGLTQQLVRADEAHRKHIARDLHDLPLQHLFYIKQVLLRNYNNGMLIDLLDETIKALRQTIKAQRPSLLDQDLPLALQALVEELQERYGPHLTIRWLGNITRAIQLSDEESTALYRIAQEALNNALKHAQARCITVELNTVCCDTLKLSIEDDGIGSPNLVPNLGRTEEFSGLLGMQERATMIHARLHLKSAPGQGTSVLVEMKA